MKISGTGNARSVYRMSDNMSYLEFESPLTGTSHHGQSSVADLWRNKTHMFRKLYRISKIYTFDFKSMVLNKNNQCGEYLQAKSDLKHSQGTNSQIGTRF